jgi:hypothetical protein
VLVMISDKEIFYLLRILSTRYCTTLVLIQQFNDINLVHSDAPELPAYLRAEERQMDELQVALGRVRARLAVCGTRVRGSGLLPCLHQLYRTNNSADLVGESTDRLRTNREAGSVNSWTTTRNGAAMECHSISPSSK